MWSKCLICCFFFLIWPVLFQALKEEYSRNPSPKLLKDIQEAKKHIPQLQGQLSRAAGATQVKKKNKKKKLNKKRRRLYCSVPPDFSQIFCNVASRQRLILIWQRISPFLLGRVASLLCLCSSLAYIHHMLGSTCIPTHNPGFIYDYFLFKDPFFGVYGNESNHGFC